MSFLSNILHYFDLPFLKAAINAMKYGTWFMWAGRWWMIQCCFDGWSGGYSAEDH